MVQQKQSLVKPPDMSGDRLFRLLSTVPYPVKDIGYRFSFAPDEQLQVRAITRREILLALDSEASLVAIIQKCLQTSDGDLAFDSIGSLMMLTDLEALTLANEVTKALDAVCPIYSKIDTVAWMNLLHEGARHISNFHDSWMMCDTRMYHYYGLPVNQINDGHVMAYSAACKVIRDFREEQKQTS